MSPAAAPFDLGPAAQTHRDDTESGEGSSRRMRGATRVELPEEPPAAERDPRRPVRIARGINALLVVLALVGTVQVLGLLVVEVQRLRYSESEIARLESEVDALWREADDLRAVAERSEDERYRELLARRQGYVFPWETRFIGPGAR